MRHITDINELKSGRYKITNIKEGPNYWKRWPYSCDGFDAFQNNKHYICSGGDIICAVLESLTPEEQNIIIKEKYDEVSILYDDSKFNSSLIYIDKEDLSDKLLNKKLNEDEKKIYKNIIELLSDTDIREDSLKNLRSINDKIKRKFINSDELVVYLDWEDWSDSILRFDNFKYIILEPDIECDVIEGLPEEEIIDKDFIYKVDDSNKFTVELDYDTIDEFITAEPTGDIKRDTIKICTIDTKIPIIQIQKTDKKYKMIFLVDIKTEDGREFRTKAYMKTKEEFKQLLQETIDMLNDSKELCKYADDLSDFI